MPKLFPHANPIHPIHDTVIQRKFKKADANNRIFPLEMVIPGKRAFDERLHTCFIQQIYFLLLLLRPQYDFESCKILQSLAKHFHFSDYNIYIYVYTYIYMYVHILYILQFLHQSYLPHPMAGNWKLEPFVRSFTSDPGVLAAIFLGACFHKSSLEKAG